MCKKFVSVLLVLCLLLSTISISAFADEVDVGWTDAKREEFMERVYADEIGVLEIQEIMGQDKVLDDLIVQYIDATSRPVDGDESKIVSNISEYSLVDSDLNIIFNPYASEYSDVKPLLENVCKVYVWFDDALNESGVCSGCLIGENTFLTAAHCVYLSHKFNDFPKGTKVKSLLVVPIPTFIGAGSSPASWPSGAGWCDVDSVLMDYRWTLSDGDESYVNYDWAVFKISQIEGRWRNTHAKGVRSIYEMPNVCPVGQFGQLMGYPAVGFPGDPGRTSGSLTVCNGVVEKCSHTSRDCDVYHLTCTSKGGMSGGPIFDAEGYVVGVLNGTLNDHVDCAVMCRFDSDLVRRIQDYIG